MQVLMMLYKTDEMLMKGSFQYGVLMSPLFKVSAPTYLLM